MRKLLVVCAIAAVAAAVVSADASAAPVRSTLVGSITSGGGWCCGSYATVEGVGTVAGVGHVSFVADWQSGCNPYDIPIECNTIESVVLTAKNGDTLALVGGSDARDEGGLVIPWTVWGGTGRFASVSGSGTFSLVRDYSSSTGTVTLTGSLSR
ncbi:MAG TPA: hypothetical protein VKC62_03355 [Gaiellaceae bacterium]|jgi:hypothetical protein|nr:hypothetical protein [Gaiellaceae bacterium]